jgi:hypothetical protein
MFVKVASHCSNAVRSIHGTGKGPYGHIVQEIQAWQRDFASVLFVHEKCSCNIDAPKLARSSVNLPVERHLCGLSVRRKASV